MGWTKRKIKLQARSHSTCPFEELHRPLMTPGGTQGCKRPEIASFSCLRILLS
jgi:hypothetical protein